MNFSTFIESSLNNGQIDADSLAKILQLFASKLHLQHLDFDPSNFDATKAENLKDNFNIVNLSKRVEGVEEVTRQLLSTFEAVKVDNRCLCGKLEETRAFANKIFDEIEKLKSSQCSGEIVGQPQDDDKTQQQQKLEKLEEIISEKFNNDSLALSALDGKVEILSENFHKLTSSVDTLFDRLDDLTFACEQLEGKSDEIDRDMREFNTRLCCVGKELKRACANVKNLNEKSISIQSQLDHIERDKPSISDLTDKLSFFTLKSDFLDSHDVISHNVTLIDGKLADLAHRNNILLAQLQNKIAAKLNVDELSKFNESLQKNFDAFILELERAINRHLAGTCEGFAGKLEMSCVSCDAKPMAMVERVGRTLPAIGRIASRFKHKTCRYPAMRHNKAKNKSTSDILELLAAKGHDGNSYIIAEDRSVLRADAEQCMEYPKV